ncbi:similar to Saccharomyces cerevisiae YPL181W CTI6 Protein that relieves transcriptional repression by binding to the Cyc8p-Tup1p corepressor and recruiting the SAGA complex to the repressed promoter [Maudiozyma barnettii]|uniref:Similar to Saccharomyces cerevisiae YPL181W CTI6 Protein that relieves transcriptional repression by binding to the Cyc8p-Tup1p corepressor and recruiting the SAGA complex to the repressed promoter n=1 Tax=Maudiozyma barnettii TaxID=61262 RepID=A0A8H2ZH85_9SACH|nr:Cti6p [Kazachstania barnettii]CAB4254267.1 similar to Saccharomyces cerevisiae YPL181W CTI6 Protein that relieves transcriptional repression by binding to the Cyc8p-Tup1p corepressor and recruiting the SAGA complex to the repressed promoter [Kazachstania barnettii]CAD1782045.1 similar to Saccharomyces cerevisiae YPL181W CTI6 Protein that relieves transcriptional repression by binding to the Cyc8p-Tup1p corepressor and recruiting the SAGA complex to the repressed promoter [Kazachstania barnetti
MSDQEEEEITRCVCGEQEPADESGLYIQCEQCSVWQHGFCVGIVEEVPDKYWCEQCKPELHDLYTDEEGRKRSHYLPVQETLEPQESEHEIIEPEEVAIPEETQPEKRNEDVKEEEQESNEQEQTAESIAYENEEDIDDEDTDLHALSKRASRSSREEQQYQRMLEQAIKESQMDTPGDEELANGDTPKLELKTDEHGASESKEQISIKSLEDNTATTEPESQTDVPEDEVNQSSKVITEDENTAPTKERQKIIRKPNRITKKPRRTNSRRNLTDKRNNSNSKSKDKLVDVTANNSVKPRLPSQRTTMNEMRRRTSAILEFISRTQWDLENVQLERDDLIRFVENDQFIEKIDNIFSQNKEALTVMNDLTQKLLNWEKHYSKER